MICPHCGEDIVADDLLHALECDGQQGAVEAMLEDVLATSEPVLEARHAHPETSHDTITR